jgi:TonB family protein
MRGNAKQRDWQTAKEWLLLSDEAGDADAPYILGVWSIMGTDIPAEDAARAREWFTRAADRVNYKAMDVLDLVGRGRTLQDAVRYVLKTPYEERYVQRIAAKTSDEPTNGILPPRPVRVVRPIYPLSMRYAGTEGEVVLEFTVDVTGRVRDPKVVKAAHPLLAERAMETIFLWRFKPGQRNGRLVNTRLQVPIIFRLEESMLDGADGMLTFVQSHAQRVGGEVLADTQILEMARSIRRLPLPVLAGGEPPAGARALVVLVLDATGRVQRGHIIEAQPTELGPVLLEIAKNAQFEPVRIDGVPTAGSVVLPFMKQP